MSDQPVTIREHIHQALLAAGPVGLTMAALAEAVAGPWSARGVQDAVRRLWDVGELARRQDRTFLLSERTARETRQGDRELDEGVRRVAERARRASHQTEVRVRKVDPALLRAFCPRCHMQVMPRLDGRCPGVRYADGRELRGARAGVLRPAATEAAAQGAGRLGAAVSALRRTEGPPGPHVRQMWQGAARRLQPRPLRRRTPSARHRGRAGRGAADVRGRAGLRVIAAGLHPRTGYKTVASCARRALRSLQAPGLELRPQREVTAARNYKHGESREQTRSGRMPIAAGWRNSGAGARCKDRGGRCARA